MPSEKKKIDNHKANRYLSKANYFKTSPKQQSQQENNFALDQSTYGKYNGPTTTELTTATMK